jgi:hypothetical protein
MLELFFCDTETLSLARNAPPWEVAWVTATVEDSGLMLDEPRVELLCVSESELVSADPNSLRVNAMYERWLPYRHELSDDLNRQVAEEIAVASAGRVWVGAVPEFDERVLHWFCLRYGFVLCPHYHLVDVEALAAAKLGLLPPFTLRKVMEAAGVERSAHGAHTALGDMMDVVGLFAWVYGLEVGGFG